LTVAHPPTPRSAAIRGLMGAHVANRLTRALKKWGDRKDAQAKQAIKAATEKYRLDDILKKGIKASHQIAVATHIAKGIHPDLDVKKTSNLRLRAQPDELTRYPEIGSHLLSPKESIADTTGNGAHNAATYELYLLLDLEFEGKTLCQWLEAHDLDTLFAFVQQDLPQNEIAPWAARFTGLMKAKNAYPATDSRARQVYWLTGTDPADDAAYHLLAPLYPTALVHAVYGFIHEDRFGDSNKDVRQARYKGEPHGGIFYDYPELVVRKLGGSKPQNISQLNSERGGVNYLLPSLPPRWQYSALRFPKDSDELWTQFFYFKNVRTLVKNLANFLLSNPKDNIKTRLTREGIEQILGAQLVAFSEQFHEVLEPGWTRDAQCELDWSEQLWLDPQRAELFQSTEEDEVFRQAYHWSDWPNEVAGRFGNWLNAQLRKAGLTMMGDVEYLHWVRQAIVDAKWPVPMQRRAPGNTQEKAGDHA